MKPHRLCMTHHLVLGYGLHKHMEVYVSRLPSLVSTHALHAPVHARAAGSMG